MGIRPTLIKIYKPGKPVSYIKGISHYHNNVCRNTFNALNKSTHLLFETHPSKVKGKKNSEDIIYKKAKKRKMKGIYLDKQTKKIRKKLPRYIKRLDGKSKSKRKIYSQWLSDHASNNHKKINKQRHGHKDDYHTFMKLAVRNRNKVWIKTIKKRIRKRSCFILCGDDHVEDLLQRLTKLGYQYKPIKQSYF